MEYSKEFINLLKDNQLREHLDIKDFKSIYEMLPQDYIGMFTQFCLDVLKINPLEYMTKIPKDFLTGTSIKTLVIPNNVTTIEGYAFSGCSGLSSIKIPNSVTTIGDGAFENCESLTSIAIPDSVTSIGWYAFCNCSSLTNIKIPNSVTQISEYAFENCESLTNIKIPNSVTNIGYAAFRNCSSLTSIKIPNSVTTIEECTFASCSKLKEINFNGTKKEAMQLGIGYKTKKNWRKGSSIKKIICSDGVIEL